MTARRPTGGRHRHREHDSPSQPREHHRCGQALPMQRAGRARQQSPVRRRMASLVPAAAAAAAAAAAEAERSTVTAAGCGQRT